MAARGLPVSKPWRGISMWAELLQILLVLLLILSGIHRFMLWVESGLAGDPETPEPFQPDSYLPEILVQIPVYNDAHALQSQLDCLRRIEYPRSKLQIQILDDSDDGSARENANRIGELAREGIPVSVIRRDQRSGYKAGALAAGLVLSEAEFVAIFDADFQIPERFLLQTLPHFDDPAVGWVQCRWGYTNRDKNFLTRAQARLLDGHFRIEHRARSHGGRFFNFNGTAGLWRRKTIDTSGGWSGRTVVEDTDLSMRAWNQGWRGVYRDDIVCHGLLPESFSAFRTQQRRWLAGGMQLLLTPAIERTEGSFLTRFDFNARAIAPLVSVVVVALTVLAPLRRIFPEDLGPAPWVFRVLGTPLFESFFIASAFIGVLVYYASTGGGRFSRWMESLLVLLLGTGFSFYGCVCCCAGILGQITVFERTPKSLAARGGRSITLWEWGALPLLVWLTAEVMLKGAWSALPLVTMSLVGLVWSFLGSRGNAMGEGIPSGFSSTCRNVSDSVV